jgi:hypothetical protein
MHLDDAKLPIQKVKQPPPLPSNPLPKKPTPESSSQFGCWFCGSPSVGRSAEVLMHTFVGSTTTWTETRIGRTYKLLWVPVPCCPWCQGRHKWERRIRLLTLPLYIVTVFFLVSFFDPSKGRNPLLGVALALIALPLWRLMEEIIGVCCFRANGRKRHSMKWALKSPNVLAMQKQGWRVGSPKFKTFFLSFQVKTAP